MTVTGDAMSSVARDAAAGAARRRRERRYRSFWRHELMAVKMATLTACHHSAQKKLAATHAATQTDVTHGKVTPATGLVNMQISFTPVETFSPGRLCRTRVQPSQSRTDPYTLLQGSSVRVRGARTCDREHRTSACSDFCLMRTANRCLLSTPRQQSLLTSTSTLSVWCTRNFTALQWSLFRHRSLVHSLL